MSRTYKRVTEDLDPERGNAFTIYREDVVSLVKELPTEITAPIFDAFIRWFCNVDEPELKDAITKALVEQLKERQRASVRKYRAVCDSRSPNRAKETNGETQVETSIHKPLNKTKVKNEDNEVKSSVLYGDEAATTDGLLPTATPSSSIHGTGISKEDIIEARKVLSRYAPAPKFIQPPEDKGNGIDDYHLIDERAAKSMTEVAQFFNENNLEECWSQVSKSSYASFGKEWDDDSVAQSFIGNTDKQLREAWRKYHDTLGDNPFLNTIWTFRIALCTGRIPATDKDGNKTNEGKLLFGRLKKLVEAKAILTQYDEQRKR